MNPKLSKIFCPSAGLVLVAMAIIQVIGNQGGVNVQPADPLLGLSSRYIFWVLAIVEGAIGVICLFSSAERLKHMAVFWLASYLVLFRMCLYFTGVHSLAPYFGTVAVSFEPSGEIVGLLFSAVMLYLLCGSTVLAFILIEPTGQRETHMSSFQQATTKSGQAYPQRTHDE